MPTEGGCILELTVQNTLEDESEDVPEPRRFFLWANNAFQRLAGASASATIRIVCAQEMQAYNAQFREKDAPTNVLSFEYAQDHLPNLDEPPLLGDILLCHSVIKAESAQANIPLEHHYAHLVTHGVLHLFGYDHIQDDDAQIMEQLEAEILKHIDIPNPYL